MSSPVQTPVAAIVADMPVPVSTAATPATTIQSVTAPAEIDLGSFASMFLTKIAPAVADALGIAVDAVINTMPMGAVITQFIGPTVISQYVSQGLTIAESALATSNLEIAAPNFVESAAASLFNSAEADLSTFLGSLVGPTISALVAKLPAPASAGAPASPDPSHSK